MHEIVFIWRSQLILIQPRKMLSVICPHFALHHRIIFTIASFQFLVIPLSKNRSEHKRALFSLSAPKLQKDAKTALPGSRKDGFEMLYEVVLRDQMLMVFARPHTARNLT